MQINQFKIDLNYENIINDFKIYTTSNMSYKSYAKFFNKVKDETKKALSIIYLKKYGKVYILTKKRDTLNSEDIDIKKVMIDNLGDSKDFILFKLLSYATTTIKEKEVIFDSDGLFYIVNTRPFYKTVLVDIKKDRDNRIYFTLNAKNFIKKNFNKDKSEKRDRYKNNKGILIRLKKGEKAKSYFVKQKDFDGYKRSHIDFLQTDYTKRKATKIYTLILFLEDIRKNLNKYLNIKLEEIPFKDFELKGTSRTRNREITDLIKDRLSKDGLVIEDFVKDNKSQKFIDEVKKIIKEEYNSTIALKKIKTSKSQFNLFITEEKKSENDPYNDIKKLKKPTQNILLKNLGSTKTILPVLLKELVIKQDIFNERLSIPSYKDTNNMTFYYFHFEMEKNKKKKILKGIYGMRLNKDSINLRKIEYKDNLFDSSEKEYIDKILYEADITNTQAELIIKNDKGDVNIITKTNYFSIPNIEYIAKEYELLSKPFYKSYNELVKFKDDVPKDRIKEYIEFLKTIENKDEINLKIDAKNKKVKNYLAIKFNVNLDKNLNRSRKNNTVLDILTGIKYSYIDNKKAYFVTGTKDIASSFARSNVIRKIKAIEGKLLLDEVLVMMDEYFVKNKELTVLPYPLKYLREYSRDY